MPRGGKSRSLEDRFYEKIVMSDDPNGCWIWVASLDTNGYGLIGVWEDGKIRVRLAHRVSYRMHIGPLTRDEWALHTCDTPACVAPHHLYKGDALINAKDRQSKGRGRDARGELNGRAILTEDKVREIRSRLSAGESRNDVRADYPVSRGAFDKVARGRLWSHVY